MFVLVDKRYMRRDKVKFLIYAVLALFVCLASKSYSSVGLSGEVSNEWLNVIYCAGELAMAAGYLFYGFFSEKINRHFLCVLMLVLYIAGIVALAFSLSQILFMMGSIAELFAAGIMGGEVLYRLAVHTKGEKYCSLIITICCMGAYLLQFAARGITAWAGFPVMLIILFTGMAFLGDYAVAVLRGTAVNPASKNTANDGLAVTDRVDSDGTDEGMLAQTGLPGGNMAAGKILTDAGNRKTEIARTCALVFCMLMFVGLVDGMVTDIAWNNGGVSSIVYSWPRLLVVVGYLLTGLVSQFLSRRNALELVFIILPVIAVNQLLWIFQKPSDLAVVGYISLFYLGLGVISAHYHLVFIGFAQKGGKYAGLWAGFGRVLEGLVTVIVSVLSVLLSDIVPLAVSTSVLWMLIIIIMIFAFRQKQVPAAASDEAGRKNVPDLTEEEWIERFAEAYGLTDREKDVFTRCVTTEDIGAAMAAELSISRRLLQKYIASIYEKTGTESQVGLLRKFYEMQKGEII